jgi:hypothetical protein
MARDGETKSDPKNEAKADGKGPRLYDKRTVERNIKKGFISRKDYDKHLKTLDDVAEKGSYGLGSDSEAPGTESGAGANGGGNSGGNSGSNSQGH